MKPDDIDPDWENAMHCVSDPILELDLDALAREPVSLGFGWSLQLAPHGDVPGLFDAKLCYKNREVYVQRLFKGRYERIQRALRRLVLVAVSQMPVRERVEELLKEENES